MSATFPSPAGLDEPVRTQAPDPEAPRLLSGPFSLQSAGLALPSGGLLKQHALLDRILRLQVCDSELRLRQELISLTSHLGFDSFIYGGRFPSPQGHTDRVITSYTGAWRSCYQSRGYAALDPTVQHALSSIVPLVWGDEMYVTDEQQQMREEARLNGIGSNGVTYPIHAVTGDISLVSFTVQGSDRHAQSVLAESMGWGSLLGSFVHDSMRRLSLNELRAEVPQLTTREAETLKWVAAGKTTWEISRLLAISEHGVVHHVRNVMKKFDVTSRHQAAVRAISLGLI